ncbi:MAG: malonyl-ACP O-methyltransferase BioC [Azoarcus sp.]|nr:malonyl-ACP O-methyltransferase BioC [Azoarcus sp.]
MNGIASTPPKKEVRRAFDRAAHTYDAAARVQRETARHLLEFARQSARNRLSPETVRTLLDAGCGTGQALSGLAAHFPQAQRIALDFSAAMLARACLVAPDVLPVCADLERLPLPDDTIDLYWSNLALQWCNPADTFREVARVLSPSGEAWIATLGPRTLYELRAAFSAVDNGDHLIDFTALDTWIAAARDAGLSIQSCAQEQIHDFAADLRTLLAKIKEIGASAIGEKRRFLGRRGWQTLQSAYEGFRRPDGTLPATYDLFLFVLKKSS